MAAPVSDEFLVQRVKALHNRLATQQLLEKGIEVTADKLAYSLKFSTVSVVETTVNGKAIRIVTTNDPKFYRMLADNKAKLLLPGEVLGSRPTNVYGPKEVGKRPPIQRIHAEQLGVNDAVHMGAKSGRIATSNAGCTEMCVSLLNDEFPAFQHVNPANAKPDATVHVLKGKPSAPMPDPNAQSVSALKGEAAELAQAEGKGVTAAGHGIENRMTTASRLDAGAPKNVVRAIEAAEHVPMGGASRTGLRLLSHPGALRGLEAAEGGAKAAFKARTLLIGLRTWRSIRSIGRAIATFLLPTGPIDAAIMLAFEIVANVIEHFQEQEARRERNKQRALEAMFKQADMIQTRIQERFQPNPLHPETATAADDLTKAWNESSAVTGFLYARVSAQIDIETLVDAGQREIEDSERYHEAFVTSVVATPSVEDLELKEISRRPLEVSDKEKQEEKFNGGIPRSKVLITRRLKYTLPTPIYTPFDIVIAKINNLFLDTTFFIWEFDGFGEGMLQNFNGFDYRMSYMEQFGVQVDFPVAVNAPACRDMLAYLHWAAQKLSRHSLQQVDIEGRLENLQRAHARRVAVLGDVYHGTDPRTGKAFRTLLQKIPRLVKAGYGSDDVVQCLRQLRDGVENITFDLSRIWEKRLDKEYLYLGPKGAS